MKALTGVTTPSRDGWRCRNHSWSCSWRCRCPRTRNTELKERYLTERATRNNNNAPESFKQYCRVSIWRTSIVRWCITDNRQYRDRRVDELKYCTPRWSRQRSDILYTGGKACSCIQQESHMRRKVYAVTCRTVFWNAQVNGMIAEEHDSIERYIAEMWAYMSTSQRGWNWCVGGAILSTSSSASSDPSPRQCQSITTICQRCSAIYFDSRTTLDGCWARFSFTYSVARLFPIMNSAVLQHQLASRCPAILLVIRAEKGR